MIQLPCELQRQILEHLSVNDVTKCRLVSRSLRGQAEAVLLTIKHIDINQPGAHCIPPRNSVSIFRGNDPSYTITVTPRLNKVDSLLRFIAKFCPNISTIDATGQVASFKSLLPLASNLVYFSFEKLKIKQRTDAQSIVNNFTALQGYDLQDELMLRDHICPLDVLRGCRSKSRPFVQCTSSCDCDVTADDMTPSIKSLCISNRGYDYVSPLELVQPSALDSLEVLYINDVTGVLAKPFKMVNLKHFALYSRTGDLTAVPSLLSPSLKLERVEITGPVDRKMREFLQSLIVSRPQLKYLAVNSIGQPEPGDMEEVNGRDSLSFSIGSKLICLDMKLKVPFAMESKVSSCLKSLILTQVDDFLFDFPSLVVFRVSTCSKCHKITSIIKSLSRSPGLKHIEIGPTFDGSNPARPAVDDELKRELANLFSTATSLITFRLLFKSVRTIFGREGRTFIHLDKLKQLRQFNWVPKEYPVTIKFPSDVDRINIRADHIEVMRQSSPQVKCTIALASCELLLNNLRHFSGEMHIYSWGARERIFIWPLIGTCRGLTSVRLDLQETCHAEIMSVVDALLRDTCVKKFHLTVADQESRLLWRLIAGLRWRAKNISMEVFQSSEDDTLRLELRDLVTSVADAGGIIDFKYHIPNKPMYELWSAQGIFVVSD